MLRALHAIYPDVLGAITQGERIHFEGLQCALGVFPRRVYVNQPFEVVLILQSMIDQPLDITVEIKLPSQDDQRRRVALETPKTSFNVKLAAGEVSVLRAPVISRAPTQGVDGLPIMVKVGLKLPKQYVEVRPPDGGPRPSVLSVSPFKLMALRDVQFGAQTSRDGSLITRIDIDGKKFTQTQRLGLQPHYETLWTVGELAKETKIAQSKYPEAKRLATDLSVGSPYAVLTEVVLERFHQGGMSLHPGEVRAISKMMVYTTDVAPTAEREFPLENMRWFQRLCQLAAQDDSLLKMHRTDVIIDHLWDSVLWDSVLLAFYLLRNQTKENLGDRSEQIGYANRVVRCVLGQETGDLSTIYLPLVLGGVLIDQKVVTPIDDNPWDLLDLLEEATRGRRKMFSGDAAVIFSILDDLMKRLEEHARKQWGTRQRRTR